MSELVRVTGWFKSSYSSADSDNCVEVRMSGEVVGVRDSKNPRSHFCVSTSAWGRFVERVRHVLDR